MLPALGDWLFGAAVPGLFRRDALQNGLHIVGREDGNVLHRADHADHLERIDGADLMDVGRIVDGRGFIEVDLHRGAGLVGQDGPAAVIAAALLPLPDGPVRPGHVVDGAGMQAVLMVGAVGKGVLVGLWLFEGQQYGVGQPDHPDALVVGQRIAVMAVRFLIPIFRFDFRKRHLWVALDCCLQRGRLDSGVRFAADRRCVGAAVTFYLAFYF